MKLTPEELKSSLGRVIAVVPARMGSSRFPGKPLAALLGRPLVEHVVRRASRCGLLDAVYVATCDEEIRAAVESFGGEVVMTSPAHERASDRVAEAAAGLEAEVVVMIQGDEPLVTPRMIEAALAPLCADASVSCVNLARRIDTREEYLDRNTVKVVANTRGDALYFTRAPVPEGAFAPDINGAGGAVPPVFKQVCVIPFRRDFLLEFARLPPTPLERAESIDMLRAVEHGRPVRLVEVEEETHAVDTPEDLRRVEALMKSNPLVPLYVEAFTRPRGCV